MVLNEECKGALKYDYVIGTSEDMLKTGQYTKVLKNQEELKSAFAYMDKGIWYVACHAWLKGEDGKKVFGQWSEIHKVDVSAITPQAPVISKVIVKGSTVTVKYTKSKNAQGYDVVLSDTQMKVYLNLDAIIANVKRLGSSTKAIDMSEILSQAVTSLLPLVTDGVPLTYEKNEGKLKVYLNTDLLLPLMKNIVAPLFSDEEFVNMLIEAMKADPDFGSMAGMAEGMLKGLPEIINETTRLEVGLNLTAAK